MEKIKAIFRDSAKCGIFVLLFLALIQPFGIENLKEGRITFILTESVLAFISVFICAIVADMIVSYRKNNQQSTKRFILNHLVGFALNTPVLGAMLLTYNSWFNAGDMWNYWFYEGNFTLRPLCEMSMYVAFITIFIMIFEFYQYRTTILKSQLDEVCAINALLEKRQEKIQMEEECTEQEEKSSPTPSPEPSLVTIVGNGQGAVLEVDPRNIIYVESMANYADICYIADNETKHTTLRITLKQIRETLDDTDCIIQCHRAFLVNINFVVSMTDRNSGYQLQMFGMEKLIPVSRANTEVIKANLNR